MPEFPRGVAFFRAVSLMIDRIHLYGFNYQLNIRWTAVNACFRLSIVTNRAMAVPSSGPSTGPATFIGLRGL
jgi:hypothetical protein